MPSNADLKKALEKANRQVALKDKQINELNAKLSAFFKLEEAKTTESALIKNLEIESIPEENEENSISKTQPIDIKQKQVEIVPEIIIVAPEAAPEAAPEGVLVSAPEGVLVAAPEVAHEGVLVAAPEGVLVAVPEAAPETKIAIKKKKSRSIWRLYIW